MKRMFAVAAVLAMTTVHAEELKFGDVNYFLKKSQQNVTLDVDQTFDQQKQFGDKTETRSSLFQATYGYAFSDQLNAFVGAGYAWDRQTENKTTTANSDIHSDGMSNPLLGVNYRLLNQNTSRYNLDFGAVARINVQDAVRGAATSHQDKDGNFADGRNSLEVNARMGRKWNEANEWQLAAGAVYHTDGEQTNKSFTGDQDIDLDSSLDFFLRATYQYRPVNEFMMLLSLQATHVGEAEGDIEGPGGKIKADAYTDLDLKFAAKYLITETFIAKFNYAIAPMTQEINTKINGVGQDVTQRNRSSFGLGIDFLF